MLAVFSEKFYGVMVGTQNFESNEALSNLDRNDSCSDFIQTLGGFDPR